MRSARSEDKARTMTGLTLSEESLSNGRVGTSARRQKEPCAGRVSAFRGSRQDLMTVIPAVMTSQDGVRSGASRRLDASPADLRR